MKNADCKVRSQRLWLSRVRSPNLQFSELSDGGGPAVCGPGASF